MHFIYQNDNMKKGEKLKVERPKQYIQGWTEFYKLKFHLTEDALIPRPETELLVDEVLKLANGELQMVNSQTDSSISHKPSIISILDLGTGSGAIAIAIAKNLPNVKIIATDISEPALAVARKNAKFHRAEKNIFFIQSDLLSFIPDFHLGGGTNVKAQDIIVANLPYIPTARLMYIDPMVTEFEPIIALDGGQDGFELYRKLFTQIEQKKLYPKYLIGEIDYTHAEIVQQEVRKHFPNAEVEVKHDLAQKQRYFIVKF